jgi:hypothetical protein
LDRLPVYADELVQDGLSEPVLDRDCHVVSDETTTIAYFVTLDTINFGSGYFPCLRKRPGMSGYYTIAASLADHFRREGPLGAEDLARMRPQAVARLFGQEGGPESIDELMGLFASAWNDLGLDLIARFGGSFTRLVEAAGKSGAGLVRLLATQPLFRDVALYGDLEVPLYKRAQILVSDLALALGSSGLGRFEDLERLTIFADNVVPHVLRLDGLLIYEPSLLARIERGDLIPRGSEEEIEIRACAVHAVELLVGRLHRLGRNVTARDLDNLLWMRGRDREYKAAPRHRTRTVFY